MEANNVCTYISYVLPNEDCDGFIKRDTVFYFYEIVINETNDMSNPHAKCFV